MKQTFVSLGMIDHQVLQACRGVVNTAVPHLGSTLTTLANLLAVAETIHMDRRSLILKELERASEAVRTLDDKYSQCKGRLPVLTMGESRGTSLIQASVVSWLATCHMQACMFRCLCGTSTCSSWAAKGSSAVPRFEARHLITARSFWVSDMTVHQCIKADLPQ